MNRPVDHAKRQELLDRVVDHVLTSGVTSFTLRPLAAATGTSARMLMHHFGSRDALAQAVVLEVEARLVAAIGDLGETAPAEAVRRMWTTTREPAVARFVRAVFEIWGAALVQPERHAAFLERVFAPWRNGLAAALEAAGAPSEEAVAQATLLLSAFNGLQLARLTTGEDAAATRALELVIESVDLEPSRNRGAGR